MPSVVNLADLGRRVRAVRMARQLTLEDVVSRAEFTVSWLSKLENGQLTPSLEGLVKLANVLECGVEQLVEGLSVPPQYVVVRRGEGRVDPPLEGRGGLPRAAAGYVVESLADAWRARAMNPTIIEVAGDGNRQHPDNHDGERFLLVLDGELVLQYGDDVIRLATGDSVYIYAAIPHVLLPADHGTARVLSVSYDPRTPAARPRGGGKKRSPAAEPPAARARPRRGKRT